MTRKLLILAVLLAGCISVASGVLAGRLTNRWQVPDDLDAAAARLDSVRGDIGPWHVRDVLQLTPDVASTLQCAGYVYQNYVNQETGEMVAVVLLAGPAGPISVHTPEICYSAADFKLEGQRKKVVISPASEDSPADEAWSTRFAAQDMSGGGLQVYYTWSDGGRWQAAAEPRVTFAGRSFLYKLQMSVRLPPGATAPSSDAGRDFLNAFLPAFRRVQANAAVSSSPS